MTDQTPEPAERSYGCSFGCGNPYDYVVIDVQSSETLFLCVPDFVRVASDMVSAITNPDDPSVVAAMVDINAIVADKAPGPKAKRRGKNAPVGADDDDLLETFESVITVDELPDAFR
jgi:hypothetical protein